MSKKNAPSVLNRIKPGTNAAFNVIFIILSLMCVLPIVLIFIISITDEQSIAQNGYQIIPDMLSAIDFVMHPLRFYLYLHFLTGNVPFLIYRIISPSEYIWTCSYKAA